MMDFYPRPPRGGRPFHSTYSGTVEPFLPTPSTRRATGRHRLPRPAAENFYPRPPRGGRRGCANFLACSGNFYPRPPRGGRRCCNPGCFCHQKNFYPRPPRGGRPLILGVLGLLDLISTHALHEEGDPGGNQIGKLRSISTHALHEEGDPGLESTFAPHIQISTHALHEEGDRSNTLRTYPHFAFLPTPSTRRATSRVKA